MIASTSKYNSMENIMKKVILSLALIAVTTLANAKMPAPYDVNTDVTSANKTLLLNNSNSVEVIVENRPITAMAPFAFNFKFADNSNIESVNFTTNMEMNMGRFVADFPSPKDTYITEMILPKCGSGRTLWYGKLLITYKDKSTEEKYFFYNTAK